MRSQSSHGQIARPRRHWRDKFGEAFRGTKRGVRGQSSFFVHFFFAALALAARTLDFSHYDLAPAYVQQQIVSKAKVHEDEDE